MRIRNRHVIPFMIKKKNNEKKNHCCVMKDKTLTIF